MEKNVNVEHKLDERLIEEIKSHQMLYDPCFPGYNDFDLKQSIWKQMAGKLMAGEDETKSISALKVRWKSLRNAYAKERRYEMAKSSGGNVKPKKPWRLKERMDFLAPFVQNRKDVPSGEGECETNVQLCCAEEISKTNANSSPERVCSGIRKNIFNEIIPDSERGRWTEIDYFFRGIADAVKGFGHENQLFIKKQIMELVLDYKLRELEEQASLGS